MDEYRGNKACMKEDTKTLGNEMLKKVINWKVWVNTADDVLDFLKKKPIKMLKK